MGLFSGVHWGFDLFNHFRPQAVIAGIFLAVVMLLYKDKGQFFLALGVIAINIALMGGRMYDFHANKPAEIAFPPTPLSLISANVHTSNTNYGSVINLIKEQKPDIFVAIETNDAWIENLKEIETDYPYTLKHPQENNFGMAVYSKIPFLGRDYIKPDTPNVPLLAVKFKNFLLLAMHPIPPINEPAAKDMPIYFAKAVELAGQTTLPVIITGDLNATLWSDNMRHLLAAGFFPANPYGTTWTWPWRFLPFAIQIDHVFTRNASVRSFTALKDIGSDHYPIKASIDIPALK